WVPTVSPVPPAAGRSGARPLDRRSRRAREPARSPPRRAACGARPSVPGTRGRFPGGGRRPGRLRSGRGSAVLRRGGSSCRLDERREVAPQLRDRAEDAVLGGAGPDPEGLSDLRDRTSLEVPQDERRPLHGVQVSQRSGNSSLDFRGEYHPLRPGAAGRYLQLFSLGGLRLGLPGDPASQEVHGAVGRDPVKPGRELGLPREAFEASVGFEESLLDHVFGVLLVSGHPECQSEDIPAVPLHQALEGLPITRPGSRDRGRVGSFHSCYLDGGEGRRLGEILDFGFQISDWNAGTYGEMGRPPRTAARVVAPPGARRRTRTASRGPYSRM